MIDFNTEPYNDDFDENDKFYRILFRPSFAVQARELTQLQTILQNQIKRHGDHVFKQGAMVIPGQISIDTEISYVKIQPIYAGAVVETYINNLEGLDIVGENGLTAKVLKVENASGSDFATLYIRYTNSADDNTTKVFANDEILTPVDTLLSSYTVQAVSSDATGIGSIASIERGVYYVNGHFVLCDTQTVVLDKYSSTPSYRVGLTVDEQLITPENTGYERLLDNAQNSYNFAAPGAHRYYIDLTLSKKDLNSTDDVDFVELLRVDEGQIKRHVTTTEYSVLEKTLARRTYDESGNYTVRPFKIDIREHRNNNRGEWNDNTAYLIGDVVYNGTDSLGNQITYVAKNSGTSVNVPPTHTTGTAYDGPGNTGIQWEYNQEPYYNRGIYSPEDGGDEAKLAVGLEPGKAYVQGYEIEKIATEYVTVDKARTSVQVDNAVIPATVGNYVLVTNVNNLPPVHTFDTLTIYDRFNTTRGAVPSGGTAIGTARVRGIEWHNGTIGSQSAIYKLFLFDIKLNSGVSLSEQIKSFYFNVSSDTNLSFTADIYPETQRFVGSATSYTSNTYATQGSGTYIQGNGTSFQTELEVGDWIYLGTSRVRVTSIDSQTRIQVDTAVNVLGVTIDELTAKVYEPENTSLVYQLPYYAVKNIRSALGTNDTTYSVYERFTGTTSSAAGGFCTLTVTTSSGTFASAAETDNYILVNNSASTGGTIVPVSASDISISSSTVQFTLPDTYAATNFIVIAAVNKSGATLTEKSKTLQSGTVAFTTAATATVTNLPLGKADGYRLISVMMDTGTFASPSGSYTIDITDRYDFDDGQRDTHYGVAHVTLKSSFAPPSAPVQVKYEYFNHSTGDYFTVNSYPANVPYGALPSYNGVSLRDCIDFRPRIDDAGAGFSGAGSSTSLVPKRGIDVRADFQYYLPRKTKIAIDFGGNFFAIDGVPSLNPGDPIEPSLGMVLYNLKLESYTFGTTSSSVEVTTLDNKRYTMRDIGKLEKRIDNLEYYTSLSLLEQQTESLDIIDSTGLNRFKNGFIVDGFTGHNTGDVQSPDYLCSIDMEKAELRPFFSMQNVNLVEKATTNAARAASNYKLYGDVITLPVVEDVVLVKQEYASRLENINPFAIFTFLGNVQMNPSSDEWFEVDRRPDLVIEVEGNFNTINTIAQKAGVLGTVWNSWQTQWTGTPQVVASYSYRQGGGPWRIIWAQTEATQIGQTRTGVKTSVVAKIDRQVVADRVLSTAAIPYIRSRNVLVQVKGLKPNTRFYPFFDDVSVAPYCNSASRLTYTPVSGNFDTTTNVGGLSGETARRIDGDSQVCLNRGDVITGQSSGATAVVVGTEYNPDTNTYVLFILNIKGTFTASEQILGSISGARGTYTSLETGTTTAGSTFLVTNFSGELNLLFNIPNQDSIRFRTGVREFKLLDVGTANAPFTSRGRAQYRAEGVLETRQQTVNAVRNAQIVEEVVRENQVVVSTSERIVAASGWYDPLAQTFLVQQKGGAFLSKIDIFFASKDTRIPVNLEIREVVNGYPGKLVLPFSKVTLKPEQVNLSANNVTLDGVAYPKYDTATTFTFPSPVFVQDNQEYAIVLSSDSNNYKVWISQIGDLIPGSSRTISEQPYAGVLFKSQNASTWTADQSQDLKFTIYRCKFATGTVGNVEFVNDVLPYQRLEVNPFETRSGFNKIRVWHRDHGMPSGSRVVIDNVYSDIVHTGDDSEITGTITTTTSSATVTGSGTNFTTSADLKVGSGIYTSAGVYVGRVASIASATSLTLTANAAVALTGGAYKVTAVYNGIPSEELYTTHIISDVDLDSYCITVATNATATGYEGGSTVKATRNLQFDSIQPVVQLQSFSETATSFGIKTTTGKSVDSTTQTAYVKETSFAEVLANENNQFYIPQMVASEVNENNSLGGNKSMNFNVTMETTNDSLSPIIDTQRISAIVVSNKINNATETNTNVATLDYTTILSNSSVVTISGNQITTSNTTAQAAFKTATVGKYLTISGASSGSSACLITAVASDGSSITFATNPDAVTGNVTLVQREMFVDEIAPMGSSTYSKYVTKKVFLANGSNFLRVRFAAAIPADASVEVYYKTNPIGSTTDLDSVNYTKINSDSPIVNVQLGDNKFIDMNFSATGIPTFDAVQVKLVFKSQNSSAVPRVKDLRVIACA